MKGSLHAQGTRWAASWLGLASLLALFAAVLMRSGGFAQEPGGAAPQAAPVHRASGAELFISSGCSHCHAIRGAGGAKGPDLSSIGRRWKDDQIRERIVQGTLVMPAYGDVLSKPDLEELVHYLHQQRAKESKRPSSLQLDLIENSLENSD